MGDTARSARARRAPRPAPTQGRAAAAAASREPRQGSSTPRKRLSRPVSSVAASLCCPGGEDPRAGRPRRAGLARGRGREGPRRAWVGSSGVLWAVGGVPGRRYAGAMRSLGCWCCGEIHAREPTHRRQYGAPHAFHTLETCIFRVYLSSGCGSGHAFGLFGRSWGRCVRNRRAPCGRSLRRAHELSPPHIGLHIYHYTYDYFCHDTPNTFAGPLCVAGDVAVTALGETGWLQQQSGARRTGESDAGMHRKCDEPVPGTIQPCPVHSGDVVDVNTCAVNAQVWATADGEEDPPRPPARDWWVNVNGPLGTTCRVSLSAVGGTNGTVAVHLPDGAEMTVDVKLEQGSQQLYPHLTLTNLNVILYGVDHLVITSRSAPGTVVNLDYLPSVMDVLVDCDGCTVTLGNFSGRALVVGGTLMDTISQETLLYRDAAVAMARVPAASVAAPAGRGSATYLNGCLNFEPATGAKAYPSVPPTPWMASRMAEVGINAQDADRCKLFSLESGDVTLSRVESVTVEGLYGHAQKLTADATGTFTLVDVGEWAGDVRMSGRSLDVSHRYSILLNGAVPPVTTLKTSFAAYPGSTLHADCADGVVAGAQAVQWRVVDSHGRASPTALGWGAAGICGGTVSNGLTALPALDLSPSQLRLADGNLVPTTLDVGALAGSTAGDTQIVTVNQQSLRVDGSSGRVIAVSWHSVDPTLNLTVVGGSARVHWTKRPDPSVSSSWRNSTLHLGRDAKVELYTDTSVMARIPLEYGTPYFNGVEHTVTFQGLSDGTGETRVVCIDANMLGATAFLLDALLNASECNIGRQGFDCEGTAGFQLEVQETTAFYAHTNHSCADSITNNTFVTPPSAAHTNASLATAYPFFKQQEAFVRTLYFFVVFIITIGVIYDVFMLETILPLVIVGFTTAAGSDTSLHIIAWGMVSSAGSGWDCTLSTKSGDNVSNLMLSAFVAVALAVLGLLAVMMYGLPRRCCGETRGGRPFGLCFRQGGSDYPANDVLRAAREGDINRTPVYVERCVFSGFLGLLFSLGTPTLVYTSHPIIGFLYALLLWIACSYSLRWVKATFNLDAKEVRNDEAEAVEERTKYSLINVSLAIVVVLFLAWSKDGCSCPLRHNCTWQHAMAALLCMACHSAAWVEVYFTTLRGNVKEGDARVPFFKFWSKVAFFTAAALVLMAYTTLFTIVANDAFDERVRWHCAIAWLLLLPLSRCALELFATCSSVAKPLQRGSDGRFTFDQVESVRSRWFWYAMHGNTYNGYGRGPYPPEVRLCGCFPTGRRRRCICIIRHGTANFDAVEHRRMPRETGTYGTGHAEPDAVELIARGGTLDGSDAADDRSSDSDAEAGSAARARLIPEDAQ